MAPKASAILRRTRVTEFDIEGEPWRIEFRPFSSDMLREAQEGDEAEQFDGICKLLGQTVVAWNLEGDDGQPLPVEGAGMAWLRAVGLDYVKLLLDGIVEEIRVGKPSDAPSGNSLRRVV
jgi:hypothetical protein